MSKDKTIGGYTYSGDLFDTKETLFMNISTGSVDVQDGWDDFKAGVKDGFLVAVEYDEDTDNWVEKGI